MNVKRLVRKLKPSFQKTQKLQFSHNQQLGAGSERRRFVYQTTLIPGPILRKPLILSMTVQMTSNERQAPCPAI